MPSVMIFTEGIFFAPSMLPFSSIKDHRIGDPSAFFAPSREDELARKAAKDAKLFLWKTSGLS